MDVNPTNPYTTEIPVSEAEKELHHTTSGSLTPPAPATPETAPPPLPPRPSLSSNKLPLILVGILLLVIGSLAGYIFRGKMTSSPAPMASTITPTKAPSPSPTPTSTPTATMNASPSSNRFSSTDLGIIFDTAKILPDSDNQTVHTQIDGSRVYVYVSGTQASAGQYVDVLSKISTDTTAIAAQKITAGDPLFQGCTLQVQGQTIYPPTYEQIIPICPNQQGGGLRYFLADSLHPTRLLYFSIGQYGIPASDNPQLMWHDTLRFL